MTMKGWLDRAEQTCEAAFFRSRWALVPGYIVLIASLVFLVLKTVTATWALFGEFASIDENTTVVRVLGVVDLVLVMNLVLMVVLVGYVNFVSKIHFHNSEDKPHWLERLNYSGLKVQMMGSILAIATVKLLRAYFSVGSPNALSSTSMQWLILIYGAFIFALVGVAVTDRLQGHKD